jgi:hypothetical protein
VASAPKLARPRGDDPPVLVAIALATFNTSEALK